MKCIIRDSGNSPTAGTVAEVTLRLVLLWIASVDVGCRNYGMVIGLPSGEVLGQGASKIARLAALVPKPKVNLTRFPGVFAPNSKHRASVTKDTPGKGVEQKPRMKDKRKRHPNHGRL